MTLIEVIWLASGLLALGFTGIHLRPLYLDWQAAIYTKRMVLQLVAGGYLRREILRFLQGAIIVIIGAWAIQEPPVIPGPARISITGLIITAALVSLSLLVTTQSAWDWHTREQVEHYVEAEAPTENAILLVNGEGIIKYSNNVADLVFGRRLVGVQVEELIPERLRTAHREHRAEYAKHPTPRPMGLHLGTVGLHDDGTEFPIFATLSTFTDEMGATYTMVTAKLDTDSVSDVSDNEEDS